jgi:tetratricopeptide (TPR) repeat protein
LKRVAAWLLVLLGGALLGYGTWRATRRPPPPPARSAVPEPDRAYAGSAACRDCHPHEFEAWSLSLHARHAVPQAEPEGGMDAAVGSMWMQAYLRRDALGYHRIVPDCFDLTSNTWQPVLDVLEVIRGTDRPYPPLTMADLQERSFETDCAGCHASGMHMRMDPETGHMQAYWRDLAIDCEACHGPCREHAEAAVDAPPVPRLQDLPVRAAVAVCARCHGGPPTVGDFSPADAHHFVGEAADRPGVFPDGTASGQVYQYAGFSRSPCYLQGGLRCTDCHDAHGRALRHADPPDEMCTRCHEAYETREHTHHDPAGEGARCVACHMPRLLTGLVAHQRDHRIGIPLPASPYVPDACTACHPDDGKAWADEAWRTWWGEPPQETLDAIRAVHLLRTDDPAAIAALEGVRHHPDPFFRATAAQRLPEVGVALEDPSPEVRMAVLRAEIGRRGDERRFEIALADPEPLVRAAALVALGRFDPLGPDEESDLETLTRHRRAFVIARHALARHYLRTGRSERALRHIEEALGWQPESFDLWWMHARAARALGRTEQVGHLERRWAEALVRAVVARRADPGLIRRTAGERIEAGEHEAARVLLETAVKRLPPGRSREETEAMWTRFRETYGDGAR